MLGGFMTTIFGLSCVMPAAPGFRITNFCGCELVATGVVGPVDSCRCTCGVTGALCVLCMKDEKAGYLSGKIREKLKHFGLAKDQFYYLHCPRDDLWVWRPRDGGYR